MIDKVPVTHRAAPIWTHAVISISVAVGRGFSLVSMKYISMPTGSWCVRNFLLTRFSANFQECKDYCHYDDWNDCFSQTIPRLGFPCCRACIMYESINTFFSSMFIRVVGAAWFSMVESKVAPTFHIIGVVLISLSLFADAVTMNMQVRMVMDVRCV